MDCSEILRKDPTRKGQDGVYVVYIENTWREVFCDMTTEEGGWTVIQKREDEEEFYRTWNAYKHGFGNASKSYWLGNDAIYELTKNKDQELRVDLEQFNGSEAHALYSSFSVGNKSTKYTLTLSGYSGTAGNGLGYHSGMKFTTKDQDNDKKNTTNCAVGFHGAWWYNACTASNLNGGYAQSAVYGHRYLYWKPWTNGYIALKRAVMMIRRKN